MTSLARNLSTPTYSEAGRRRSPGGGPRALPVACSAARRAFADYKYIFIDFIFRLI